MVTNCALKECISKTVVTQHPSVKGRGKRGGPSTIRSPGRLGTGSRVLEDPKVSRIWETASQPQTESWTLIYTYGEMKVSHCSPDSACFPERTLSIVLSVHTLKQRNWAAESPVWEDILVLPSFPLAPLHSLIVSRASAGGRVVQRPALFSTLLIQGAFYPPSLFQAPKPQSARPSLISGHGRSLTQQWAQKESVSPPSLVLLGFCSCLWSCQLLVKHSSLLWAFPFGTLPSRLQGGAPLQLWHTLLLCGGSPWSSTNKAGDLSFLWVLRPRSQSLAQLLDFPFSLLLPVRVLFPIAYIPKKGLFHKPGAKVTYPPADDKVVETGTWPLQGMLKGRFLL